MSSLPILTHVGVFSLHMSIIVKSTMIEQHSHKHTHMQSDNKDRRSVRSLSIEKKKTKLRENTLALRTAKRTYRSASMTS